MPHSRHINSLSRICLWGREPPTPELSIQHFYPPDMELNGDIEGIGRKEVRKPRMPPYTVKTYPIFPRLALPIRTITADRLPSGRCEEVWDAYPNAAGAAFK